MTDLPQRERWSSAIQALGLVISFWWLATGLLLGLPRTASGQQAVSVIASLLGGSGLALAIIFRQDTSPRAAWLGFLAGGTLWGWTQAALYGGWLVGPGVRTAIPQNSIRFEMALEALRATAWSEAATLGVLLLSAAIAVGARNRMPFWTVLLFWSAHQAARLNVFFGVANSGSDLLPQHLAFLKQFFGPASNSPLLPVTIAVWVLVAATLVRHAWRSPDLYHRRAGLVLGVLAWLAALEHLFLALPASLPLWQPFLRIHSS
jgi:putative photosynthetic complex assembly protein 2